MINCATLDQSSIFLSPNLIVTLSISCMIFFQIGSTEWVEENRELLASRAVAYINVDIAVAGPGFDASSTPQIDKLLEHVTQQVSQCYCCGNSLSHY